MTKKITVILTSLLLIFGGVLFAPQSQAQMPVKVGNTYYALNYGKWTATVMTGFSGTGVQTMSMLYGYVTLGDGTAFVPFGITIPLSVDTGTNRETVTPTSVSGCYPLNPNQGVCQVTATFANAHGNGTIVTSGDGGLNEAIAAAWNGGAANGGGMVVVDQASGVTDAQIIAAVPYWNVGIQDLRNSTPVYWNVEQTSATILAAGPTLTGQVACDGTHQFCSDTTVAGTWTAAAIYGCVAYVDILGQEGPCGATNNFTAVVSKAVDVVAPVASPGAVGFVIYIGSSYLLADAIPLTNAICTLTVLETTTPACAINNTTYGQVASTVGKNALFTGGAQIPNIFVTTSPGMLLKTTASATTAYVGTPNGRIAYGYTPGSHPAVLGVPSYSLPFAITTGALSTVPNVAATINIPAGFLNYLGKTFRVCGFASSTGTSTATVTSFTAWYEASLSNVAGPVPLLLGGPAVTDTLSSAVDNYSFCQDFTTTTTGATGALLPGTGLLNIGDTVNNTHPGAGGNFQVGAVGGDNLVNSGGFPTHLHIVYLHTTGTDGAGMIMQKVTFEVL